jgi:hypothetical protein
MATPTNLPAPAVAGQVLTAAYVNQLAGAFRVLQIVSATTTTVLNTASTSFSDAGLSATITPESTSNKILCLTFNACAKTTGNVNNAVRLQVLRGATVINSYRFGLLTSTDLTNVGSLDMIVLDSPASVSAQTYKVQIANEVAASVAQYAANNTQCTMILMEISA